MEASLYQSLIIGLMVGAASGAIGSFVILKRMALVGDAMSHIALPGIALALLYGVDPFFGVLAFLVGAAVLVWWLEGRTKLAPDALVGLLFTSSLAIGILAIPNAELLESLFGEFPALSPPAFFLIIGAAFLLIVATFALTKRFLLAVVSPELAHVTNKRSDNLILFLIFAFVVALGIKLVGTLLMGALTIIPASIAKNSTKSMKTFIVGSAVIGGAVSVGGVLIARTYGFIPGPTIILLGAGCFVLSLGLRRS
ncbi:MAG: hypothetical protein A3H69_00595 [Candidatus Sungbacteria bacterium RIFCSPLOWO2_02_FULL_47_9]|uniref:High-affinity zinc uptake system membrane protein ZnuB n=1 Tax=Candidatus Sungbacteria bacterium RIFCSPHIGHO2_01_FULL_47_32 TaxID=1802264 RepID=A0A1G2K4L4_9BACT|nr:MAG: High-affinity zinc uptake system membrane protein [Parcubacteria group bacterium GW2011_GWA2_47_10]OGZ93440.1 MAG: hypothetical protein A2633_01810 [Candidatus Sungbacteria bacterium RIFCSPHIGHO2_01_FULL_47_32]OGZ99810.1 MAG: hypothetical protein A3D57_01105 [Candidatus Sungbacteria bacterium RIFCSPHIGHO2_02_FULL_46_12]OHA05025.1 MAG: hypothetical protein A3A28_03770 [Candidatus Sungbacteria bacterium RIFCSPLOWO2_01_FULL_47_32]OHA11860.1 MAG: hypothetical protein A3H69_00595 [Candidatus